MKTKTVGREVATVGVCQIFSYYHPVFAGAAIRHNRLAVELIQNGSEVFVLTPRWKDTKAREDVNGVTVYRIPVVRFGPKWLQYIVFGLLAPWYVLRHRKEFQVLHSFGYSVFYLPALVTAKWLAKRVIVESTLMKPGEAKRSPTLRERLETRFLKRWDAYVGISRPLIAEFLDRGAPSEKVKLLPPSVETEWYIPASSETRRSLRDTYGYDADDVVICFVGSITQRKGADVLVRAFSELGSQSPQYHLLMVGDYEATPAVEAFKDRLWREIEEAGLIDQVRFTGRVDDQSGLVEYLQLSDIFAFPSRREGFGTALIEAMSVGLACVSGEMKGVVDDIVESGRNGIVVPTYGREDWAEAIRGLGESADLRDRLGREGRRMVVENFSREGAVRRQLDFYRQVLELDDGATAVTDADKDRTPG